MFDTRKQVGFMTKGEGSRDHLIVAHRQGI